MMNYRKKTTVPPIQDSKGKQKEKTVNCKKRNVWLSAIPRYKLQNRDVEIKQVQKLKYHGMF